MRYIAALIPALALLLACSPVSTPATDSPALELTGRVVDAANILSPEVESRIDAQLAAAERRYGQQLVVATTPSLNGMTIEDYSFDLANSWKIGRHDRNDGLLLLVAPNERKVRIEVGLGLEASFTDQFAGEVIRDAILPLFKEGKMAEGIESGVDRLVTKMKAVPSLPANENASANTKEDAA